MKYVKGWIMATYMTMVWPRLRHGYAYAMPMTMFV